MVQVKKCCCVIPIKAGAYIIGCTHVLELLIGLVNFSEFRVTLNLFCGVTFLLMVFRDSKQKRLYYFSAYAILLVFNAILHLVFVFWRQDEHTKAIKKCKEEGVSFPLDKCVESKENKFLIWQIGALTLMFLL